uniref:Uncharacterized protein n=1 Tax=Picea glauca TaxID=3330 RepID=A0A124GP95_PICGL|nr:hypothetical protein ABT39_MTgene1123 [Picea glauca]
MINLKPGTKHCLFLCTGPCLIKWSRARMHAEWTGWTALNALLDCTQRQLNVGCKELHSMLKDL